MANRHSLSWRTRLRLTYKIIDEQSQTLHELKSSVRNSKRSRMSCASPDRKTKNKECLWRIWGFERNSYSDLERAILAGMILIFWITGISKKPALQDWCWIARWIYSVIEGSELNDDPQIHLGYGRTSQMKLDGRPSHGFTVKKATQKLARPMYRCRSDWRCRSNQGSFFLKLPINERVIHRWFQDRTDAFRNQWIADL